MSVYTLNFFLVHTSEHKENEAHVKSQSNSAHLHYKRAIAQQIRPRRRRGIDKSRATPSQPRASGVSTPSIGLCVMTKKTVTKHTCNAHPGRSRSKTTTMVANKKLIYSPTVTKDNLTAHDGAIPSRVPEKQTAHREYAPRVQS